MSREAVQLTLNGAACSLRASPAGVCVGAPLLHLLRQLGYEDESLGSAVAINDAVVPRSEWKDRVLLDGDRVEIVGAVQGG